MDARGQSELCYRHTMKKKKAEMEPVKNSSSHNFTQDPNDPKLVLFVGFSHFTLSAHCFMRL